LKIKDKETKKVRFELQQRNEFTEKQCELVAGQPFEEGDQDSYEALMTMEDKEIRFWTSVNKLPNFMEQEEWDEIVADYNKRMDEARVQGIQEEKDKLDAIFQTLELKDLSDISTYGLLPRMVEVIAELHQENGVNYLRSRKWDENLCLFDDMWRYESIAKERQQYYNTNGNGGDDDRYEQWLDYKSADEFLHGDSGGTQTVIAFQEEAVVEKVVKTDAEVKADMVDAMNAIEQYHKNVAKQNAEELVNVTKHMESEGYILWENNSFIKQEWVDNGQPYKQMALPYKACVKMYESTLEDEDFNF